MIRNFHVADKPFKASLEKRFKQKVMSGGQIKFGRAKPTQLLGAVQSKDIKQLEQIKHYWFPDYGRA